MSSSNVTDPPPLGAEPALPAQAQGAARRLPRVRSKTATVALVVLGLLILLAILAPYVTQYTPTKTSPLERNAAPSFSHLLGTDSLGRDSLTRVLYGLRVSLSVAVLATLAGATIGVMLGATAGYIGGRVDSFIAWIIDMLLSFPSLITGIMIVVALGAGYWSTVAAIAAMFIARFARLARASAMTVAGRDYVTAVELLGLGRRRVLTRHILPNISSDMLGVGVVWMAQAIVTEASLSFLGLGVQPPTPSLGSMVQTAMAQVTTAPWVSLGPGAAIVLSATAITIVGDFLQSSFDPQLREMA